MKNKKRGWKIAIICIIAVVVIALVFAAAKLVSPEREISQAEYDLASAKRSYELGDYKWTIVQAYYSLFHSAQAILRDGLTIDLSTNPHAVLHDMLNDEVDKGNLPSDFVRAYDSARTVRSNANYRGIYTEESARKNIERAQLFLAKAKELNKEKLTQEEITRLNNLSSNKTTHTSDTGIENVE